MYDIMHLPKCYVMENEHFANFTVDYDTRNVTSVAIVENIEYTAGHFDIGPIISLVFAVLINFIFSYEIYANDSIFTIKINLNTKTLMRILCLTILLIILPFAIVFLLVALIYKTLCSLLIRNRDRHFVKFLDSFDVFWCLEDNISQNIINVVGIIESKSCDSLVNDIRQKLENIITNYKGHDTEKIFYRRNEQFGFYYWRMYNSIDMNEYVQSVEHPSKCGQLETNHLEEIMTELSYKPLPYNNEGLFQILVTKNKIRNANANDVTKADYGIIFRIHHSIGDGVALIEFLCKTLADESNANVVNMFPHSECLNSKKYDSVGDLLVMMKKLCEIPISLVDNMIKERDSNALHGPPLAGNTFYKWTDHDENLLLMIKEIKEGIKGITFSEVLSMALSRGLRYYFLKTAANIPDSVAVIVPIRFPKKLNNDLNESSGLVLKNDFSVAMLDLPVRSVSNINDIREKCNALSTSADPLTNYYFLKIADYILPKQILEPLLNSVIATVVLSNMPGPDTMKICGGNLLKSLVFFIPHKGTTGLGVTALRYGGVLRLGASVDSALVTDPDDLSLILDAMVDEIKRLHREVVDT